jgi:hypothetical protein
MTLERIQRFVPVSCPDVSPTRSRSNQLLRVMAPPLLPFAPPPFADTALMLTTPPAACDLVRTAFGEHDDKL